jgi:hypothetical protein
VQVEKGKYFAWGDDLARAVGTTDGGPCLVEQFEVMGENDEVVRFEDGCTTAEATKICEALGADTTFLDLPDSPLDEEDEDED